MGCILLLTKHLVHKFESLKLQFGKKLLDIIHLK